jgi:hypothetical protein
MDTYTALSAFGQALRGLPFGNHPALRIGSHEGYKSYRFGVATGRLLNIQALCHELAHAVQFGPDQFDDRVKPNGYGFRFPVRQVEISGRFYDNPLTGQCSRRESEVLGIQLHLQEALGRKYPKDQVVFSHVKSFDFLPDWISYGGSDRHRRYRRLASLVTSFYEEWHKADIYARLEGWLDRTQDRLRSEGEPSHGMMFSIAWPQGSDVAPAT